jgi:hypothetical protein
MCLYQIIFNRSVRNPNNAADAATISHYPADAATEFAGKLSKIADGYRQIGNIIIFGSKKSTRSGCAPFSASGSWLESWKSGVVL